MGLLIQRPAIICINFLLLLTYKEVGKEERLERNRQVREGKIKRSNLAAESLREAWAARLGLEARVGRRRATVEHVFTHLRLSLEVFDVEQIRGPLHPDFYTEVDWRPIERLDELPVSRLTRKVFAAVSSDR